MFYRAVSVVLICTLLPQLTGCTIRRTEHVPRGEVESQTDEWITGVTTVEGEAIKFDEPNARAGVFPPRISNDTIYARVNGEPYEIAVNDVTHLWLKRKDDAASIVASFFVVLGVLFVTALVAVLIVAATKDSCPFIYSWDGERYVFDAEPYGGATTRGLERDDYAELEHLRADGGSYRLRVTNEVRETQFTNLAQLWVVDHAPGLRVVPDEWGNLHTIANPQALSAARDGSGRDLTPWLRANDAVIWEPEAIPDENGELRQEIVMSFPKPEGAAQARLVANAATGLWGSYMISEMLELRGEQVDDWYALLDGSPAAVDSLMGWVVREETWALRLEVWTETGWELRGIVPGGGPFIAEDRVVPLDISGTSGDQLQIRIRPPRGYWALNWFAVDYGVNQSVHVDTVSAVHAVDHGGRDVLPALLSADSLYWEMPQTGDYGEVTFPAPAELNGLERTVILHSRGYYRLHLEPLGEPDVVTLQRLAFEPGYAATFAAERYAALRAQAARQP